MIVNSKGAFLALVLTGLTLACCLLPVAAQEKDGSPAETAEVVTFDVWEYRVTGNTALDRREVERAVYPHLGPQRTIDDVESARVALESAYANAGFGTVLVNIPEQDVEEGVVFLEVIEGRVDRVRVTGSRYFSLGRIKNKVPSLASGKLPHLPTVQAELGDVNRASSDLSVTPGLNPGRTTGAVDVELRVADKRPLHGEVELNDRFTRNTTRTRLNVALRYDNLWQREHSFGLSFQTAPQATEEVKVISATYLMRPPVIDALLALYAVKSDSDVATFGAGGPADVIGTGNIFGARLIKQLPRRGRFYHNLTFGFDYKEFEDTISLVDVDALETPIDYHKFVVGYGGFVTGESSILRFRLDTNFSVRGLGNEAVEFDEKRVFAQPNMLFLRGNASYETTGPFQTQLLFAFSGQVAGEPIISNEQFSLGGVDTVRGYVETAALVDNGAQVRAEIRSPEVVPLAAEAPWNPRLRFLAFVDGGYGKLVDPLPDQVDEFGLASVGFGATLASEQGISSAVDWAVPVRDAAGTEAGDTRVHFRFGYEF